MKILCSGERFEGPIDKQVCETCALNLQTPPCGYSYPLVKAVLDSQEDRKHDIHVTDVIGCLLKAYYSKVSPQPRYLADMLVLFVGTAVHKAIQESAPYEDSEIPVRKGGIVGKVDYVRGERITDFKTTRWLDPTKDLPYGNQTAQINLYRDMLEADGEMWVQYVDLSGPTTCRKCKVTMKLIDGDIRCPKCGYVNVKGHLGAMQVRVPRIEVEDYYERARILSEAIDKVEPPDAEPSWLCNYCPAFNICAEGQLFVDGCLTADKK